MTYTKDQQILQNKQVQLNLMLQKLLKEIRDILKKRIAESKKAKKGTKNVKENTFKKDDKKKECNIQK